MPVRLGVLVAGLAGPALLFAVFAERFGLGWDTPLFLADLRAVGYVPFIVMPLLVVWLASTGQLAALSVGRYAPYPAASELPPTGPVRRVVRRMVLGIRNRRRRSAAPDLKVLEG